MHTLVVYESQFGNTAQIAQAIVSALGARGTVRVASVETPGLVALDDVDLLVLGGPTHDHTATPDILGWLDRLPPQALEGLPVAVFDTRYHMSKLFSGSAARTIGAEVDKRGGRLFVPPESFFVADRHGPLEAGEVERAAAWANTLLDALQAR